MSRAVLLGLAVSLSGRYSPFGRQVAEGLRCYVSDANDRGGIRTDPRSPRRVELLLEDDRSDREVLRHRVRKLVREDGVDLLLGPYGSGLTLAAAEVTSALGTVLWNHGGASDAIPERHGDWCVGVLSPASTYLSAVLEMLDATAPLRRIALLQVESGFAGELARGVERWAGRRGCTLLRRTCASDDTGAIGEAAAAFASEAADVVLGAGRFEDDVAFAEALWRARPKTRAIACVGAGIDRFGDELGERAEGFLAPVQWHPEARFEVDFGPTTEAFAQSYRSRTNEPLDYPAAQAYAGALIAQRCAERSGSFDPQELRRTAARMALTTFYGRFRIDLRDGRQTGHRILVTGWRGGRRKILWPRDATDRSGAGTPPPGA